MSEEPTTIPPPAPPAALPFAADEERKKHYAAFREELVKKQNSNSENYDKSILTLSSGGLGLSLAFIKDVVKLHEAIQLSVLVQSWGLFAAAIVVTILSFQTSQQSIGTSLDQAEKYYLEGKEKFLNAWNLWASVTNMLNMISGILFVAAILWTAYFVMINLPVSKP